MNTSKIKQGQIFTHCCYASEASRIFVAAITKIAQFNKGRGKIWSVWWNRVQWSVMSYLKHLKVSSSKSLIVVSLPLNTKKFCKALVDATIKVSSHSKWTKDEEKSSLCIQWHKNCWIWLRNEKNIGKCSVMGSFTFSSFIKIVYWISSFVFNQWTINFWALHI